MSGSVHSVRRKCHGCVVLCQGCCLAGAVYDVYSRSRKKYFLDGYGMGLGLHSIRARIAAPWR